MSDRRIRSARLGYHGVTPCGGARAGRWAFAARAEVSSKRAPTEPQPSATSPGRGSSHKRPAARRVDAAAFWVGLGGDDSSHARHERSCDGNTTPTYEAWWEIAARSPDPARSPATHQAAVLVNGNVTMSLKNLPATAGSRRAHSGSVLRRRGVDARSATAQASAAHVGVIFTAIGTAARRRSPTWAPTASETAGQAFRRGASTRSERRRLAPPGASSDGSQRRVHVRVCTRRGGPASRGTAGRSVHDTGPRSAGLSLRHTPGSAHDAPGIRLIGYDRAGLRRLDAPRRAASIAAVVRGRRGDRRRARLERFATWGISGGGPHALACAALCGDRLIAAAQPRSRRAVGRRGSRLARRHGRGQRHASSTSSLAGEEALRPSVDATRRRASR